MAESVEKRFDRKSQRPELPAGQPAAVASIGEHFEGSPAIATAGASEASQRGRDEVKSPLRQASVKVADHCHHPRDPKLGFPPAQQPLTRRGGHGPPVKGVTLWTPGSEDRARLSAQPPSQPSPGDGPVAPAYRPPGDYMIKQPITRPISLEQLVAEVKGIYAGLIMVETKCIEVDNAQNAQTEGAGTTLNHEQWQALTALHRTLLHEHQDFFLASQHPSADPALRRLASKYAMPARMWRYGIHSFLELLRHRLPASLEHILTFISVAYPMMALLYETVPAFEDIWIECLGDLGRYRMAIENEDIHYRQVWTVVSRDWYSKASDKAPATGRLYHHLAILAHPNAFQQLFYYTKSLCVPIQFEEARDSIMTAFNPIMEMAPEYRRSRLTSTELEFVRCHWIMLGKKDPEKFKASADEFINSLDNFIARNTKEFLKQGYWMGITSCSAIMGYGYEDHKLWTLCRADIVKQDITIADQADTTAIAIARADSKAEALAKGILVACNDLNVDTLVDAITLADQKTLPKAIAIALDDVSGIDNIAIPRSIKFGHIEALYNGTAKALAEAIAIAHANPKEKGPQPNALAIAIARADPDADALFNDIAISEDRNADADPKAIEERAEQHIALAMDIARADPNSDVIAVIATALAKANAFYILADLVALTRPITLANRTHDIILRRFGDTNTLPYLHVTLVFIHSLTFLSEVIDLVAREFPWKLTALMLGTFLDSYTTYPRIEGESLPKPEEGDNHRPLPEDYAMRGLLWTDWYFPHDWFTYHLEDDDEKYMELASFNEERKERILYLGCRIAAQGDGRWLRYDSDKKRFSVAPEFDIEVGFQGWEVDGARCCQEPST